MYAVIRIEKRKGAAISAIEKHNARTEEIFVDGSVKKWAENADSNLSQNNITKKKFNDLNLSQSINQHLKNIGIDKIRKDAVKAVEILCTASPEYFNGNRVDQKLTAFSQRAMEFVSERFGKENIMSLDIHLDEKTPHIHFVIVPITKDKKLSAKTVCGNRKDYQNLQDDFSEKMKDLGLKRGIRGSNAKHIEMKEFYGALTNDVIPINEFLENRKSSEVSKLNQELKKAKIIAHHAYELLKKNNFTIDEKTLQPRKLTTEEIEALKMKNEQNNRHKL
uniref:MobV family relaxase n=1 Tax=Sphingomonas sp. TaxID=28214 RepID=UPI0025FCE94D|nr:MobV family relaxase [Sphingomonas sp.]